MHEGSGAGVWEVGFEDGEDLRVWGGVWEGMERTTEHRWLGWLGRVYVMILSRSWMRHLEKGHGILGFGKTRAFGGDKIFAS